MNTSFELKATLVEQLSKVAECFSERVAIQDNDKVLTYAEFNSRVHSVASFLRSQGINYGDRIVIVMKDSINYVVAFYAIWQLGGVVVAVNSQSKLYEIEKTLRQSQAKAIVFEQLDNNTIDTLSNTGTTLITLLENSHPSVKSETQSVYSKDIQSWPKVIESSLAQIIYTSGTTGNPKGVCLSHGNLMSNTKDIISYLKLSENDSVLAVLPFHYSYGNSILHTHLCVGAKIILSGAMAYPQEIVNLMRESGVTGFSGVPSTYSLFLTRSDWPENPPHLRYITQAGGPMGKGLTEKLLKASHQQTKLFVMYGQTEASARISWLPPESLVRKLGSVGIALDNIQIEIRDSNNTPVAKEVEGEVYVKGPNIMQGYWDNPEATKKRLIDGWLKTGDLGYLDNDNFLFLVGRNSDMIKAGSHRINPLEIEEVINSLSTVEESAVIGVEDKILGQKLHAFIVGDESKSSLLEIKKHCNSLLATYKIPREFTWLSALPKTNSGK